MGFLKLLYRNYCCFCSVHILRCLHSFHIIAVILHSISSIQSCKMLPICKLWSSLDNSRLYNSTTVILRCMKASTSLSFWTIESSGLSGAKVVTRFSFSIFVCFGIKQILSTFNIRWKHTYRKKYIFLVERSIRVKQQRILKEGTFSVTRYPIAQNLFL